MQLVDKVLEQGAPLEFPGEVDALHITSTFWFVSYTAVMEGKTSVPVGLIRAFDIKAGGALADLKVPSAVHPSRHLSISLSFGVFHPVDHLRRRCCCRCRCGGHCSVASTSRVSSVA
jgi:hypothetical protein